MTLFLTSSPCIPNADRALLNPVNGFVDRLRAALPNHPRVLFICSNPDSYDRTDHYAQDMLDAFSQADMPFGQLGVLDGRNAVEAKRLINASDFIILAGGHVPTQNAFFQNIQLAQLLEDYPGVIMGISAGSMNAAKWVYAQPELEGEAVDPAYERWLPGLGLAQINILPHYQQIRDDLLDGMRLFEDITFADSDQHSFYALVDGSYLYRDEKEEILCGEVRLIRSRTMKKISSEGEHIDLSCERSTDP